MPSGGEKKLHPLVFTAPGPNALWPCPRALPRSCPFFNIGPIPRRENWNSWENIGNSYHFFRRTWIAGFLFCAKSFPGNSQQGRAAFQGRTVFFSDHFWRMRNFMSKRSFNMSTRQSEEVDFFESYCLQIQKMYLGMWFAKIFLPNVVPNMASCEILRVSRFIFHLVLFDIENYESWYIPEIRHPDWWEYYYPNLPEVKHVTYPGLRSSETKRYPQTKYVAPFRASSFNLDFLY